MNLIELGGRIKELREKRGLKQIGVANALQISAQAVSKWERGENAPDISVLIDLARLLGVSCDTLLGRREKLDDTFEATVFCTSLNHFAERSSRMPPRDVAGWANGLFHLVTEAVVRFEGVPVKYVGDGFLGFFSGPEHARRAVQAAMQTKTHVPSEDLVIALNSGDVYLGSIGHVEYAQPDIIGDTVNTAFLVMAWVSVNMKERLGVTESVTQRIPDGIQFSKARFAEIPTLKKKLKVYGIR